MVKVIASSVRKGNVLDIDGKLCVVMKAENIHPGKGTPVTHLDMRRIADGVKITERYRTTEQVERAYLEEKTYNYLFEDDTGFTFMEPETYEQIMVPKDMLGDQAVYLQENMAVTDQHARGRADLGGAARRAWCWRWSRPTPSSKVRRRPPPTSRPSSPTASA